MVRGRGHAIRGPVPRSRGRGAERLGPISEDVEGFAIAPEELIGSGSTVAAVVRYTGTGKATGKALDVPVVHVWDIRDGKLARFRQFIDTVKFAEVVPAG